MATYTFKLKKGTYINGWWVNDFEHYSTTNGANEFEAKVKARENIAKQMCGFGNGTPEPYAIFNRIPWTNIEISLNDIELVKEVQ